MTGLTNHGVHPIPAEMQATAGVVAIRSRSLFTRNFLTALLDEPPGCSGGISMSCFLKEMS